MSKQDNLTDFLTDVADAIREKKGTTDKINPQNFSEEIRGIESGGIPTAEWNDVNFYDYEGTILYSYTWDEFVAKNEMPPLPTHREKEGLVCQEWNYTLEEVLAQGGRCDVGAIYDTIDGATHFYIRTSTTTNVSLSYQSAKDVTVDWGDGNIESIPDRSSLTSKTIEHVYEGGAYNITIRGTVTLRSENKGVVIPSNALYKALLGENATLGSYVFTSCSALTSVSISSKASKIGANTFNGAGLLHVNIPRSISATDNYPIVKSSRVKSMSIPATFKGDAFNGASYLVHGVMGKNTTFTESETDYYLLMSIFVGKENTEYSSVGGNLYKDTRLIKGLGKDIEDGTTEIAKFAYRRYSGNSIHIPDSVVSFGAGSFQFCSYVNETITIPPSVSTIPTYCFYSNLAPAFKFVRHTSIPTLSSTDAFQNGSGKIVVPDNLYDEWIAATNWSTYASRIVKASEYAEPTTE